MKNLFLVLLGLVSFTFNANAQLFKANDVAKVADYVVNELKISGKTAESVKSIYADYGSQMKAVMDNRGKGLPVKQKELQTLTDKMDGEVKAILPKDKLSDYDTVVAHYRKKGIGTSALNIGDNTTQITNDQVQKLQKVDGSSELGNQLKQEFKDKLNVTDTQADQLVKITFEHNLKKKLINQTLKSDAPARAAKMNELNTDTNNQVRKILNPQQYKAFLGILIQSAKE
ncbi:MAG: hypothetical protein M9887_04435 [Chitinophagales bacterium]|nr:hypothetical protein [Chitinophagales bacterium]